MAVKIVWVLMSVWYVHGEPKLIFRQHDSLDRCRAAAIQAIESGTDTFAFCTEGYAAPLQYLPYPR